MWHRDWLGTKLGDRYDSAGYVKEKIGAKKFIFDFEQSPQTFFASAPTAKPEDPTSGDHVIPGGASGRKGWFVFSANSPALKNVDPRTLDEQQRAPAKGDQKKREYAFFDRREPKNIRLKQEAFDRFERINSKPGKTKLKPDGSYAVMEPTLEKCQRIPVFYVGDPEGDSAGFDMGLTRLFKLSHVNSVGAVLARQKHHKHSRGEPDMIEALFGHAYDRADLGIGSDERLAPGETARKGRISFGFAELSEKTPARETVVITTTAMAPRASFAPFYLRGPIKDWTDEARNGNSGEARLAGRKRYFARFPAPRLASAEADIVAALSGLNNTPKFRHTVAAATVETRCAKWRTGFFRDNSFAQCHGRGNWRGAMDFDPRRRRSKAIPPHDRSSQERGRGSGAGKIVADETNRTSRKSLKGKSANDRAGDLGINRC